MGNFLNINDIIFFGSFIIMIFVLNKFVKEFNQLAYQQENQLIDLDTYRKNKKKIWKKYIISFIIWIILVFSLILLISAYKNGMSSQ